MNCSSPATRGDHAKHGGGGAAARVLETSADFAIGCGLAALQRPDDVPGGGPRQNAAQESRVTIPTDRWPKRLL
jgi:hypothetical protein